MSRQLNITIINHMMGTLFGGAENFDLNVAKILRERGHNIRFVIGKSYSRVSRIPEDLSSFEIQYALFPYVSWISDKLGYSGRMRWFVSSTLLHFDRRAFELSAYRKLRNDNWSDVYQICGRIFLAKRLEKKHPAIVWWPATPSRIERKSLDKCSINAAGGIVLPELKKYCSNAHEVEMGIDVNFFVPRSQMRKDNFIHFIFVGRVVKVKNLPFLIKGFNEALKEKQNLILHIVGNGQEKENLLKMTHDLNPSERVIFHNHLYKDELLKAYQNADVFIITSDSETYFPNVAIEAMSCGLPVIATNVGGLKSDVLNGSAGFLIEPNDINSLKGKILFFAEHRDKIDEFGKNAREHIVKNYSWEKTATVMEELFFEAIEKRKMLQN